MSKDMDEINKEAMRQIVEAAEGGDTETQFELAEMYRKGDMVAEDPKKAMEWYRRCAMKLLGREEDEDDD